MTAGPDWKAYSKALVIGAGSGRDMASCVLMTAKLRRLGVRVDLGGFLTPWALHTFDGEIEKPVNELAGPDTKKFLPARRDASLSSYFEPELVKLNKALGLGVDGFYLFSLHYGTHRLREALEQLVAENAYDVVIALDVGGDILGREKDYPWLLTPIVDFSCLSVLGDLTTRADRYLSVVAPGVDGEMPCENLKKTLHELDVKGLTLSSEKISRKDSAYQLFSRAAREINSRTTSFSNTFRIIDRVLGAAGPSVHEHLHKRIKIGDKKWQVSFPIDLESSLAERVFHFELPAVYEMKGTPLSYNNIFEAFVKMKQLGTGGTEVDLAFVPMGMEGGRFEETVFLLTPSDRIRGKQRKEIIEYGLAMTARGSIVHAIVLERDCDVVSLPENLELLKEKALDTDLVLGHLARKTQEQGGSRALRSP